MRTYRYYDDIRMEETARNVSGRVAPPCRSISPAVLPIRCSISAALENRPL